MASPTRLFFSPSKALHSISPERMNQQSVPGTPTLPSELLSLHHKSTKGVSEVQAKVAFLNRLAKGGAKGGDAASPTATNNAALQRAIIGREEAESCLESVQTDLAESQSRERRISERLDSLMEELHSAKERQIQERSIFEKEIRKSRKEAFRASSTVVKLQEELNNAKSETRSLRDDVAAERQSKERAKQESFERAYTIAGLSEELEDLKGKLRSMEAANHASSLQVKAHQMRGQNAGRISISEGDLAFLATPRRPKRAAEDDFRTPASEYESADAHQDTPPKRQRLSEIMPAADMDIEVTNDPSGLNFEAMEELQDELDIERRRRVDAEEMITFMNIECQFKRCSCRVAEREGRRYVFDADYFNNIQRPQLNADTQARVRAEVEARAQAQAEAEAREQEDARSQAQAEADAQEIEDRARAQAEAEARERSEARAKAQAETDAREHAEARARAQAEAEAREKAEAQARGKAESRARAEAQAKAQAQVQAEERAKAARKARTLQLDIHSSHTPEFEPPPHHNLFHNPRVKHELTAPPEVMLMPEEPLVTFSPETGTFKTFPSPLRDNFWPRRTEDMFGSPESPIPPPHALNQWQNPETANNEDIEESFTPSSNSRSSGMAQIISDDSYESDQKQGEISPDFNPCREDVEKSAYHSKPSTQPSTTMMAPLREGTVSKPSSSIVPDAPINREQALAQIRARRGRARTNRSVSAYEPTGRNAAPAATTTTSTTARGGPRRIPNLRTDAKTEKDRRDISAPVRMFRR
ncbi:hypothetical protein N7495_002101 [Penicillium taxi]|uniref:uncharacterized protein n=1 Tax=Penicillium taxi TaxID=168475 RepID=UPI002544F3A7|nr:uncharacterized protein N7495_002101 [Penicillium taxi]KAJ5901573.1 hypothetical protein N7495_002101 [Penicillium taxi]